MWANYVLTSLYRCAAKPEFLQEAKDLHSWLSAAFDHLHEDPELSFGEQRTCAFVQQQLTEHGVKFQAPIAKHGVLAHVGYGHPVVVLRADMDALPILENASHAVRYEQ